MLNHSHFDLFMKSLYCTYCTNSCTLGINKSSCQRGSKYTYKNEQFKVREVIKIILNFYYPVLVVKFALVCKIVTEKVHQGSAATMNEMNRGRL